MIDWPNPQSAAPFNHRKRSYGSVVRREGFQADFFPRSRVQPFLSNNGGFLYFANEVLSPQGSRFMFIIDFGGGINIFRKERQAATNGYRYLHLSNANISFQNPATDATTYCVGAS